MSNLDDAIELPDGNDGERMRRTERYRSMKFHDVRSINGPELG